MPTCPAGDSAAQAPPHQSSPTDIGAAVLRGASWQALSVVLQAAMQLVVAGALARLLTPRDFGVAASALALTGLAGVVAQMGVAPAIVQSPEITTRQLRFGFTASVLLGLAMASSIVALAPHAASFFSAPELASILRLHSVCFVLAGFSAVAEGLLQREMRFRQLMRINALSYLAGYSLLSISLALAGFGVWSLVWGIVAQRSVYTLGAVVARPHPVRPLLSRHEAARAARFGCGLTVAQLLNYAATQADYVIVGRVIGPSALGQYTRAYQLMMLPARYLGQSLTRVLFPAMSAIQAEGTRLSALYLGAVSSMGAILSPVSAVMALCAPEIVRVLLGDQWGAAVLPFRILSVGVLFRTTYKVSDSLAEATAAISSRAGRECLYLLAVSAGAWTGSRWGIAGVALGVLAAILVNYVIGLELSLRTLRLPRRQLLFVHIPGLLLATVVLVAAAPARWLLLRFEAPAPLLLAGTLLSTVPGLVILFAVNPSAIAPHTRTLSRLLLHLLPNTTSFGPLRSRLRTRLLASGPSSCSP